MDPTAIKLEFSPSLVLPSGRRKDLAVRFLPGGVGARGLPDEPAVQSFQWSFIAKFVVTGKRAAILEAVEVTMRGRRGFRARSGPVTVWKGRIGRSDEPATTANYLPVQIDAQAETIVSIGLWLNARRAYVGKETWQFGRHKITRIRVKLVTDRGVIRLKT